MENDNTMGLIDLLEFKNNETDNCNHNIKHKKRQPLKINVILSLWPSHTFRKYTLKHQNANTDGFCACI